LRNGTLGAFSSVSGQGQDAHVLAVSGEPLGFAGFLLVKSPTELDDVWPRVLPNVLKGVACGPELDGDVGIP